MISERVLSLDISSKTGWTLLVSTAEGITLEAYGQEPPISEPEGQYPVNYVNWAYMVFGKITALIDRYAPDVLVIEETASGSKNLYSQKILEYVHFLIASFIKETSIKAVYLMTETWRREVGCVMTKEEKDRNKAIAAFKKKAGAGKTKAEISKLRARDIDGKVIGKISRKHVNVRKANEVFAKFLKKPLKQKDEDTADSLLLAYCYHVRRMRFV